MPSLKQIRRRIAGVRSTAQITRAMKMVAAAKLKRAQQNMEHARPYAWKLREVIATLVAHTDRELHPLLALREAGRIGVVTVTSDRGLCGSFNGNICRRTQKVLEEFSGLDVELFTIGRKGNDFFKKHNVTIYHHYPGVFHDLQFSQATGLGRDIVSHYSADGFDRIYLVYNEFKNPVQQLLTCEQLLPVEPAEVSSDWHTVDFLFEPDPQSVLDRILPMHVNMQIWRVMLESYAAEQGARMTAMANATDNADALASDLTLIFNKARQAAITKELLEIVGGAEGLK